MFILQRAEHCAYCNCVMDRASLDATLSAPAGKHKIRARTDVGGHEIVLTDQQFSDLITVHLADWLEQVQRCSTTQLHETLKLLVSAWVVFKPQVPFSVSTAVWCARGLVHAHRWRGKQQR